MLSFNSKKESTPRRFVKVLKLALFVGVFVFALAKFLLSFSDFDSESVLNAEYKSISGRIIELKCTERDLSKGSKGRPGKIGLLLEGAPHMLNIDLRHIVPSKKCSAVNELLNVGGSVNLKLLLDSNTIVYLATQEKVLFSLDDYILVEADHHYEEKGLWGSVLFACFLVFMNWNLRRLSSKGKP
ncbi:hypothetical protein [Pseudoalteromonas luteoviolacea]|uniref:Uncharacterized protein n=1 Tax=Pseudoalteromonas luteoviolacea H33 TaxID=1365251 RepID=A0A167EJB2_9GAMM|nr:hypothetical protein [Pseudoalteromonas luteoviolacea]KZN50819.1 hypothetical protein N476_15120 [Pseudoalteromonas luteoviolacea H33]KZN74830.1 hypothetical protein N477_21205 [Pseudoalteromonas luteoviolacea H33-S]MBQ4880566.1 hypothetical protein [Pseudoalteromonas luteoviolacea]MBQ4909616.1 hypothetical protein [Pseudoalteromonas luteoviolacea]